LTSVLADGLKVNENGFTGYEFCNRVAQLGGFGDREAPFHGVEAQGGANQAIFVCGKFLGESGRPE
jgi:hypothetical protein